MYHSTHSAFHNFHKLIEFLMEKKLNVAFGTESKSQGPEDRHLQCHACGRPQLQRGVRAVLAMPAMTARPMELTKHAGTMGFYGGLLGIYGGFMGIDGGLLGFYDGSMGIDCGFMGF